MPEFILDESGEVHVATGLPRHGQRIAFDTLDSFTQGYIEALFFTESEPGTTREQRVTEKGHVRKAWSAREHAGQQKDMPGDYGFSDLAPETLTVIVHDCEEFQRDAEQLLKRAYERDYEEKQAGRDFWFTRNYHGVGFWDRNELDADGLGDELTTLCKKFGERDCFIGDDGKVYLS